MQREIEYEILGREWLEANGKAYSFFRRRFMGDAFVTDEMRTILNGLSTERAKDAMCRKLWKEHISKFFIIETHKRFSNYILSNDLTNDEIRDQYSNRRVFVDEAHKVRKEKRFYRALHRLVTTAHNVTLWLVTATPMIESAEEICPIMNLLLLSEGYSKKDLITPDDVRKYVVDGDKTAKKKLRNCFRGRVSYVRGMDPRSFPKREDHGVKLYPDMPDHKVYLCPMRDIQLRAYCRVFMSEFDPNPEAGQSCDLWINSRDVQRGYLSKDMGGWRTMRGKRVFYPNTSSKDWLIENIRVTGRSAKHIAAYHILHDLYAHLGPKMWFSSTVEIGVKRNEAFLEANGYSSWNQPKRNSGDDEEAPVMVNISGSVSQGQARDAIKVLKSDNNYLGESIGVVLASPRIRTGVTFRHFGVVIDDEVGWTKGDSEQVYGRTMRHGSHTHVTVADCNDTVHVFVLCATIQQTEWEKLKQDDPIFMNRVEKWIESHRVALKDRGFLNSDGHLLTVDERTLHVALERDKGIAKLMRMMKESAVPLALAQLYFPDEHDRYKNTRLYEYCDTPARVPLPSIKHKSHPMFVLSTPHRRQIDNQWLQLDGLLRYSTGTPVDVYGNILAELLECFAEKSVWALVKLLQHTSKEVHVPQFEVALVLQQNCKSHQWLISNDWVYTSKTNLCTIPVVHWQKNVESTFAPPDPINSLHHLLIQHIGVVDLFGVFENELPEFAVGTKYAKDKLLLSPQKHKLILCLKQDAPFCGMFDNTADNPDVFRLKIIKVKANGKGTSKIAAKSVSSRGRLDALIGLINEIDGDTAYVAASSHKMDAACDELFKRLAAAGRLLPWVPESTPSLFRMLCVAKEWNKPDIVKKLECIEDAIAKKNGAFESLCNDLLDMKPALISSVSDDLRNRVIDEVRDQIETTPHYVLRVLELFQHSGVDKKQRKRPRDLFTAAQYAKCNKWYSVQVEKMFAADIKLIKQEIGEELAKRTRNITQISSTTMKKRKK